MEKTLEQITSNCIKVVLFGPESTGKSTLAEALAKQYNTIFVPEYMRHYLQHKWDQQRASCTKDDLLPIAQGQMKLENEMVQLAREVLFCDTNLLQAKVYSEIYYDGYCPAEIERYAKKNIYDLYFLCGIDVPWVADDLRDKPNERAFMFETFKRTLEAQNLPFVVLKGNHSIRLETAITHVNQLLKKEIEIYKQRN